MNYTKFKKFLDNKNSDYWFFSEVPLSMCDKQITVLCGVNGSGKSMSLRMFKEHFNHNDIRYISFTGGIEGMGGYWANPDSGDKNAYERGLISCMRSEGEERKENFLLWQERKLFPVMNSNQPCWILLDEVDSGLTPDRIWNFVGGLVEQAKKHPNLKFIITANQYEMIHCLKSDITRIIWVPTLENWNPEDYQEFVKPYHWYIGEIHRRVQKQSGGSRVEKSTPGQKAI